MLRSIPKPHLLVWTALIALYVPVFVPLYRYRWDKIDYGHAYFVLPVALFIAWTMRDRIQKAVVQSSKKSGAGSILLIALGVFLFVFGWRNDYAVISTFSLLPLLAGTIAFLYSPALLTKLWFPILYLLFLVPPPYAIVDAVTLPMRQGVSTAAEAVLKLLQYPVSREGLLLSIGKQEVYLGEACSGLRSLITLSCLGLAYIYMARMQKSGKILMALSIAPLALLGNLVRVVAVCLVTYYWGVSKGQKFFHDFSGFVVFAVLIAGLLILENILRRRSR